jgi:adenylate cyclase
VFSGDVLNTTSRIQNECNKLNSTLLISEELFKLLPKENNGFSYKKLGDIQLRGKEELVRLYSVSRENGNNIN